MRLITTRAVSQARRRSHTWLAVRANARPAAGDLLELLQTLKNPSTHAPDRAPRRGQPW
jgi:hypothetical protein